MSIIYVYYIVYLDVFNCVIKVVKVCWNIVGCGERLYLMCRNLYSVNKRLRKKKSGKEERKCELCNSGIFPDSGSE